MNNMKHTLNSILESIFAMLKPLSKEEKRQAGIISASDYQNQKTGKVNPLVGLKN